MSSSGAVRQWWWPRVQVCGLCHLYAVCLQQPQSRPCCCDEQRQAGFTEDQAALEGGQQVQAGQVRQALLA